MVKFPKLRLLILEKFYTQRAFAKELGVSEPYVASVLAGKLHLGMIQVEKWSRALNCKRAFLLPTMNEDMQRLLNGYMGSKRKRIRL